MSESVISATCPRCGHSWEESLEREMSLTVYRSDDTSSSFEYQLTCPQCGQPFKVPVTIRGA